MNTTDTCSSSVCDVKRKLKKRYLFLTSLFATLLNRLIKQSNKIATYEQRLEPWTVRAKAIPYTGWATREFFNLSIKLKLFYSIRLVLRMATYFTQFIFTVSNSQCLEKICKQLFNRFILTFVVLTWCLNHVWVSQWACSRINKQCFTLIKVSDSKKQCTLHL